MDGNGWMAICTQLLDGMAQLGTETARHAPHGGSMGAHREDCNRARIPIVAGSSARCSIEAFFSRPALKALPHRASHDSWNMYACMNE